MKLIGLVDHWHLHFLFFEKKVQSFSQLIVFPLLANFLSSYIIIIDGKTFRRTEKHKMVSFPLKGKNHLFVSQLFVTAQIWNSLCSIALFNWDKIHKSWTELNSVLLCEGFWQMNRSWKQTQQRVWKDVWKIFCSKRHKAKGLFSETLCYVPCPLSLV